MARTILLRQLELKARTRHELEEVLRRKDVPDDIATTLLDRFTEVGLINDQQFADAWVESRQQRRHLSRRALRQELFRKGVDSEVISEAVEAVDGEDEYAAARALAEKKLRSVAGLEPQVQRRRIAGALARKGFNGGLTSQVVTEVLNADPDDGDDLAGAAFD